MEPVAPTSPAVADTTLADLDAIAHDRTIDMRARLAALQALEAIRYAREIVASLAVGPAWEALVELHRANGWRPPRE